MNHDRVIAEILTDMEVEATTYNKSTIWMFKYRDETEGVTYFDAVNIPSERSLRPLDLFHAVQNLIKEKGES